MADIAHLREVFTEWQATRTRRGPGPEFVLLDDEGAHHRISVTTGQASNLGILLAADTLPYDVAASGRLNRIRTSWVFVWGFAGIAAFSAGLVRLFTTTGNALFALGVTWPLLAMALARHRHPEPGDLVVALGPASAGDADPAEDGGQHSESAKREPHGTEEAGVVPRPVQSGEHGTRDGHAKHRAQHIRDLQRR